MKQISTTTESKKSERNKINTKVRISNKCNLNVEFL